MSRIISGQAGSIRLKSAASSTRPTTDRVKESLFAALEARGFLESANVLDLYAGTGALALEALSRGAKSAVLIEKDPSAHKISAENTRVVLNALTKSGSAAVAENLKIDAAKYIKSTTDIFDLVFIDPPYEFANELLVAQLAQLQQSVADHGVVVIERSSRTREIPIPDWLYEISNKAVGETRVAIYQKN
ncbi:MAG: 16S rRNA (guanine(966)-N(2))-methyltransferase RsmD [Aquiluna sp.]|nr:16S rRNA (guanine(966)-N(2))-methyltransferase RsmD [Aquiluna sp.]